MSAEHPYDADSRLTPVSPGRYAATLSSRFNLPGGNVNGGYGMAVCLQGLAAELEHPDPLVVSATYLRQVHPGPATVAVERVRGGRRLSVGEARLSQNGVEGLRVVATFADLSAVTGRTHVASAAPALPPPQDCLDPALGAHIPDDSVGARTEVRLVQPHGWMSGRPTGKAFAEFWMRFSGDREPDTLTLPSLVDMAVPAVFELGEFSTTTIELTVHVRARPAPGWLACRVTTQFLIGGYHEEDFEIWDSTGRLVAQSRQLQLLTS
jgi:acyl-CoA thioesterase